MNIPDKALEAAKDAYVAAIANKLIPSRHAAQIMLEAAAPHIAAQALRDADKSIVLEQFSPTEHGSLIVVKEELRYRADELDHQ